MVQVLCTDMPEEDDDEDTGEVISIDRNELILDRDHILVEEDIDVVE